MTDTFPRQYARTQRLTLGEPRNIVVSPDGGRIAFGRTKTGDDPVNCLWLLDAATGEERMVADPLDLLGLGETADDLPPEERARRERMREGAGGITVFATDRDVRVAAFSLSGRLFVCGLLSGRARELDVEGPVFDPRPDPIATRVAYVAGRSLRIAELDGTNWELAGDSDPNVTWGSADFIAAEEMHRFRGFWWSPDGAAIAACRVDVSPVQQWYIADPANPDQPANEVRYPAAGTANAEVTLHVLAIDGGSVEIAWDREQFPYLAGVRWAGPQRLLLTVQSRDQRRLQVLEADPAVGDVSVVFDDHDEAWVELVPGAPAVLSDGRLVMTADRDGARRLLIDGVIVSDEHTQVRSVLAVNGHDDVIVTSNPLSDPTVQQVVAYSGDGARPICAEPGVHSASVGGDTVVLRSTNLDHPGSVTTVVGGPTIASNAETPLVRPNVTLLQLGDRKLATAIVLPHNHDGSPLPVLLDPYGGPHAQRVVQAHNAYLTSQWFADQGFAVVICDGRGTPGRGTEFERAVHHDLASPVLEDQVDALHAAADHAPLDLQRVGIRGWSFGGYLAALAVLQRPDVFHAAIAGAPVTEWRLYDTHYTERYLGDPFTDAGPYAASSLLPLAHQLSRPLLLIHGLADDNVVAAHTLQLSSALLAGGCPHEVLPLVGVTHMTPQEVVAENLLLHQLAFLRRSLGIEANG
jgi:dipeptidyl-peptidase 4